MKICATVVRLKSCVSLPEQPRLLLSAGEPAGIGPDICLHLLNAPPAGVAIVVLADRELLVDRAQQLGCNGAFADFDPGATATVSVLHCPLAEAVVAGKPNNANAASVLALLRQAATLAASADFDALVTAPVAKSVLATAAADFSGHTEFFGALAGVESVMAFVGPQLRLALVTTHLPLAQVPAAITTQRVLTVLQTADAGMREVLGGATPRWHVCGLNPHAGEAGLLGTEEQQSIAPAVAQACKLGMDVQGPLPADTIFLPERLGTNDCVLAMYHDQGLPVIKRDDFAATVNVSFGLPYIRTSVDHGTAFELAGTGRADSASLHSAVALARQLVTQRVQSTAT